MKLAIFLALFCAVCGAQAQDAKSVVCQRWIAYATPVAPSKARAGKNEPLPPPPPENVDVSSNDPFQVADLPEQQRLVGIGCLLTEANDARPAAFGAATQLGSAGAGTTQLFAVPPASLAALYLVSYLYTGNFHHGTAVALKGEGARTRENRYLYTTNPDAIERSYTAYRAWFVKVKPMGMAAAHAQNLQPLDGTGLSWF